jgi:hypothetical protein
MRMLRKVKTYVGVSLRTSNSESSSLMKNKMKKTISILFLFSINIIVFAQEKKEKKEYEVQTLGGRGTPVGFYFGWVNKPSIINEQPGWMTGGETGLVFGHAVRFGFAGYGLVSPVRSNRFDGMGNELYYDLGYGGIMFEPVFGSRYLFHLTFPVMLGAGGVSWHDRYSYSYDWNQYGWDVFMIAETGANIELNVFKWLRMTAGASYRFTTESWRGGLGVSELSGWSGNLGLKIGRF